RLRPLPRSLLPPFPSPPLFRSAATRWYEGSRGPDTGGSRAADASCASCGFVVPLAGSLGQLFGVCANEWAPDDGKVVSLDHGCGDRKSTRLNSSHVSISDAVFC